MTAYSEGHKPIKILKEALESMGLPCNSAILNLFSEYMEHILGWNEKINLTAITDQGEFVRKHYLDSVVCAAEPAFYKALKIIDLGTGAGFPGMPLAFLFPEKHFLLVDSSGKKLKVIEEFCKKMEMPNVRTLHARAEDLGRDKALREAFDLCISRAVANLSTLSEYCLPFVRIGGVFMAFKGPDGEREIAEAREAIKILGGGAISSNAVKSQVLEYDHVLISIAKKKKTPELYPRRAGTPAREPLGSK